MAKSERETYTVEVTEAGRVVLTRKDDPQSITARDRRYAVDIFGDPRHVIRFR